MTYNSIEPARALRRVHSPPSVPWTVCVMIQATRQMCVLCGPVISAARPSMRRNKSSAPVSAQFLLPIYNAAKRTHEKCQNPSDELVLCQRTSLLSERAVSNKPAVNCMRSRLRHRYRITCTHTHTHARSSSNNKCKNHPT